MTPTQAAAYYIAQSNRQTATVSTWLNVQMVTGTTVTTTPVGNSIMNALYSSQGTTMWPGDAALVRDTLRLMGECEIEDGAPCKIKLPDGGMLEVDADGSYRLNDNNAKVTYRANRHRDFNPFVNASDKLEAFIQYCGGQGVRQGEMLDLPIKLFIGWLILQAAVADGENPEPDNLLEDLRDRTKPRCACGRFLSRKMIERKIHFCRPVCLERELAA